jgi:ribosomal protein S18 acetylase RimI-like enzyme
MIKNIKIQEEPIEIAVKISATITEFDAIYDKSYYEDRYKNTTKLILVAYADDQPAGFMVSYDPNNDGLFYCWMVGVNPLYRRLGILNKMMNYLYDWCKNKGYKKIIIKTRNNRREMLAFLVKSGFNFIEVQPKPLVKDNRILLEKTVE